MAKIFLDNNTLFDLYNPTRKSGFSSSNLKFNILYISPISVLNIAYVDKHKIPNATLNGMFERFNTVDIDQVLLKHALIGPTSDLEDNIQLHSCAKADCDVFLTNDKKLLEMKFFGKAEIKSNL